MMKKIRYILSALAAITGLAVLAACAQIVTPSGYLAGGTTGRVILSVSTGAENAARTILPTGTPVFSRYELDFTNSNTTIAAPDTSDITGAGVSQELTAGTWTVTVRAYRNFTPTGGADTEYLAARGSASIIVTVGQDIPVTVPLMPVPVTDTTVKGIFTYTVTFPADVTTAYLTIESGGGGEPGPVPPGGSGGSGGVALASGQTVSVEQDPGYYDLFITLRKGPLTAGTAEKVHLYAGLESQAEFTFEDTDFVQPEPLSDKTWKEGTLAVYRQVDWYTFSATAGETYGLQFDSLGGPLNHTGAVYVWAYQGSTGDYLAASGDYSSPLTLSVQANDTIYVSVQSNGPSLGTYALRYYDPSTEPPQAAPSSVRMENPRPDYTISWHSVGGATGYKVSHATTEEGPYTDRGSTVPEDGSYSYFFTDTGISSETHWYKVRAVNGHGEGPNSAAVEVSVPTLLPSDKTWTEGTLTANRQDWYSFPATADITYSLQFDSLYDGTGNYTGAVYVDAYGNDGSHLNSHSNGYSSPLTLQIKTNDTIYVRVQPNGPLGTYAVRYYDPSTEPPAVPSYVQIWMPDYSIRWDPVGGATGYQVSRSITEAGPYTDIGSTVPDNGSYFYAFTDTETSSGTYWYRVRAVNSHGKGLDSEPVEVSASTPLPNDKAWTEGNFTAYGQVNWYSFPATAGITYSLQFDSLFDGTGKYTGGVAVSAYQGSTGYNLGGNSVGYSSPLTLSVSTDDTIYVSVQPNGPSPGTYALRYYDPSTEPPQAAPSSVRMESPRPDYTISWHSVGGATGYQVSHATTEEGPYTDRGSMVPDSGSSYYVFTDTGISSETHWYKVRAVNAYGEGPDSAAVQVSTPTLLPNDNTWIEGTLTANGQDWYSFPVTAGITYSLQIDSLGGSGAYTGAMYVSAYRSTGDVLGGSNGYSYPISINTGTKDTIYVRVEAAYPFGTYAVRYYDTSTEPPVAPSFVQMWIPQPDYTITWNPVGGATGYRVSRSTTETGDYNQQGTTTGEYSASFTDTGVSSGTYWYKVRAENSHGAGPDSAAVKVSAPTPLPTDHTWMEGTLTANEQIDWYSFPATAGIAYSLQWDNYYDGTGKYTGAVHVQAYRSNGNLLVGDSAGYSSPPTLIVDTNDTIYVRVLPSGPPGTYALRYTIAADGPGQGGGGDQPPP
jgi:hypothetical protein